MYDINKIFIKNEKFNILLNNCIFLSFSLHISFKNLIVSLA